MAMEELRESLQGFDLDQLNDINNVGSWPFAVKVIVWVICFAGALGLGDRSPKEARGCYCLRGSAQGGLRRKILPSRPP